MKNDECGMMNAELGKNGECHPSAVHHSSFITHHSRPPRRGLSLLEVLVSIGILTLGVMGVAMLIPIGKFAMTEVEKSDRTGMCGRAGSREVKVRRMLNTNPMTGGWGAANVPADAVNVAVIDPLGTYEGGTAPAAFGPLGGIPIGGTTTVGGGTMSLPRFAANVANVASAEAAFLWRDDLAYAAAKDSKSPTNGDRPMAVFDAAGNQQSTGNVSWFFTVAGSPADYHAGPPVTGTPWIQRQLFSVSIVVCWKRNFLVASDSRKPAPKGNKAAQRNTTRRRSVRRATGSPRALAMAVGQLLCVITPPITTSMQIPTTRSIR